MPKYDVECWTKSDLVNNLHSLEVDVCDSEMPSSSCTFFKSSLRDWRDLKGFSIFFVRNYVNMTLTGNWKLLPATLKIAACTAHKGPATDRNSCHAIVKAVQAKGAFHL